MLVAVVFCCVLVWAFLELKAFSQEDSRIRNKFVGQLQKFLSICYFRVPYE